ncbi:MAG: gamma-glutamyltransferase [Planctomycetota bacterium]|nr:gamma-glutamyltransferase [Planctomycetota bacterium]MDA1213615.1 gamma-glutamyltransferase [Planctomycetota bacterium]
MATPPRIASNQMIRLLDAGLRYSATFAVLLIVFVWNTVTLAADPVRAERGMVVSASEIASEVGAEVLRDGGNAVDAAVATAFALAVTHPAAGNIGGGGFLVFRSADGEVVCYDFREMAPAAASPTMFLTEGKYDYGKHHNSHLSVGVPGTVDGLHLAWKDHGCLRWRRLIEPAIALARDGFEVSPGLAESLSGVLESMKTYPASMAQFSNEGRPYAAGEILKQPDLAKTLERIASQGPSGFYDGITARLIEAEMQAHGGMITRDDLKHYAAIRRQPVRGTYRGYDIISMPPPSSGGTALIEMLNILEGYDLRESGSGSAATVHHIAEAMRRAYADRAQYLGDPDFNPEMPIARLISKDYAKILHGTINNDRASVSTPTSFDWGYESDETTHFSVVDAERNAVSLTYTLENSYGSKIVVAGGGFLLNNEMGDFNAAPDLTTAEGLIGTPPNLAQPRKRMLSSMTPTIVAKDGKLFMVTGSPGGRTIINTVLLTIINAIDFGMNAQEAVDAGRFHHQWLPDRIVYERFSLSPETINLLQAKGHSLKESRRQGVAEIIIFDAANDRIEGGIDRRQQDGGAGIQ